MDPQAAALYDNVRKVIFGKDPVVKLALTALLADGHLLIEDAPGLGKTMLARAIAKSISATFKRIQFTPDLLPSDVTGVTVFAPAKQEFEFFPGPIFTQLLLADEINRTSPRTQSSLLESMEEGQVSVDGKTHELPTPFFVVATQNPVELEGTYPLPEAQLDRFLMRIELGYPSETEEIRILQQQVNEHPIEQLSAVMDAETLARLQTKVKSVRLSTEIHQYITAIVRATREMRETRLGVSPRGGVALMKAARAHSFLHGLSFVSPDSVKRVATSVLGHRLVLDPQAEYTGISKVDVIQKVLKSVPVPTLPHDQARDSVDDQVEG